MKSFHGTNPILNRNHRAALGMGCPPNQSNLLTRTHITRRWQHTRRRMSSGAQPNRNALGPN